MTELEDEVADERGDTGGHVAGVMAERHRRGTGVVRLPGDAQLCPGDALHAGDDADVDALVLEDRPLLDVELDEGVRHEARARRRSPVADPLELLADT